MAPAFHSGHGSDIGAKLIDSREQRLDGGFAWGLYAAEAGGAGLLLMRIRAVRGFKRLSDLFLFDAPLLGRGAQ